MRTKTILFLTSFLFLLALAPQPLAAQTPDRIATLSISVWPEYDDPSVLVIYDGEFANKDGFPREVAFLVPASAKVNATAYGNSSGEFFNTDPWKTQDAGNGWTRVLFTIPQPLFHVEYYYNPLQGAPDKKMDFVFNAANPADKVQLEIQEPLKSTNFKTDPAAATQTSRGHDFKYDVFQFSNVTAGQNLKVQVSYTKTDPNPSVANISVPANSLPSDSALNANASTSNNWILPVGIGAGGVALAVLGFLAWRMRRNGDDEPRRRVRSKKNQGAAATFCHECGTALRTQDVFCSKCGTRRKT